MRKAALLLDAGQDEECAQYLTERIKEAELDKNNAPLIIFLVALGELLMEQDKDDEGKGLLRRALDVSPLDADLVRFERQRAKELLRE